MNVLASWWPYWLAAFLIGSIPIGFLLARAKGVDIRKHGSGNIGATNVGRVLGKKLGIVCFVLDVLKGLLPVLVAGLAMGSVQRGPIVGDAGGAFGWMGVAAATILGHMFPPWLGFRGGKGVATGLGALLGVFPVLTVPALLAAATWIAAIKRWKYVSLASILAAAMLPVWLALAGGFAVRAGLIGGTYEGPWWERAGEVLWPYAAVAAGLAILVVVKHKSNIARLRAGTEPKVKWVKSAEPELTP